MDENSFKGILLVIVTALVAAILHLVVFKSSSSSSKKTTTSNSSTSDSKGGDAVLDSLLQDDDGWADDDEDEDDDKIPSSPNQTSIPTSPAAAIPVPKPSLSSTADDSSPVVVRTKKVNEGPFNIGDRVIVKNLVAAKKYNGRHGVIADLWDKRTERYPIDLDLVDMDRTMPLSVKVGNLEKEPSIITSNQEQQQQAEVINGCLNEAQARAASFIFSALRGSIQNSLKGEKDPQKISAFGWQFWNQGQGKGVYPALKEFLTKGILLQNKLEDLEKQLNAEHPRGAYQKVTQAMNSDLAVASWNVRVEGEFWIVGMSPEGTLVVPVSSPRQVYNVLGYKAPLGAQGKFPRPPKFYLTLLPWFGRLIHDPMLVTTTGSNQVELASPKLAMELVAACKLAKEEGRVIHRLAQLEVTNGSKEGLPYQPPRIKPIHDFSKMSPATTEERTMVENMSDYESMPDKQPESCWNIIRQGVTEEENPNHTVVIINGRGEKLSEFKSLNIIPTAEETLKVLVSVCKKQNQRPRLIGIDVPALSSRFQYLLQGVKDVQAIQINVTRKQKQ